MAAVAAWLLNFLSPIIGAIVRPIIQEEIDKLEGAILNAVGRKEIYDKADKKKLELATEMSVATIQEERDAVLDKYKAFQPDFQLGND